MVGQTHSFFRVISLSHFFMKFFFVGCFKAEPWVTRGNPCQGQYRLLGCPRELQGHLQKSSSMTHNCSSTSHLLKMGLCGWQAWLFVWACHHHTQPWPPDSIPTRRATGSPSAPCCFSRLFQVWRLREEMRQLVFPATDSNKEVTETSVEWTADGNCCCTAGIEV